MNSYAFDRYLTKLAEEKNKFKHYCKCGHSVIIANKAGRTICSYCKNLVFRDKETEFKYRLKEKLIKERRNIK
jgi:ribosomal protein S27AE